MILGTQFKDALLAELIEAEKKLPYGGERTFLKQVRDLINNPQYNFFIPVDKNTELLRTVTMTDELMKLCDLSQADIDAQAKAAETKDATGWGRSLSSWFTPYSGTKSPGVRNAVLKVMADARFGRPALVASDLDACDIAADLLEAPEYKNNQNNASYKILARFWSEQLKLRTAAEQRRNLDQMITLRPKAHAPVIREAQLEKEADERWDAVREDHAKELAQSYAKDHELIPVYKKVVEDAVNNANSRKEGDEAPPTPKLTTMHLPGTMPETPRYVLSDLADSMPALEHYDVTYDAMHIDYKRNNNLYVAPDRNNNNNNNRLNTEFSDDFIPVPYYKDEPPTTPNNTQRVTLGSIALSKIEPESILPAVNQALDQKLILQYLLHRKVNKFDSYLAKKLNFTLALKSDDFENMPQHLSSSSSNSGDKLTVDDIVEKYNSSKMRKK